MTTSPGDFQQHPSTSATSARSRKFLFRPTSLLYASTVLGLGRLRGAIDDLVRNSGFNLSIDCVRTLKHLVLSHEKVTLKVEDPFFAKALSARLDDQKSTITSAPMPTDPGRTDCSKLRIS